MDARLTKLAAGVFLCSKDSREVDACLTVGEAARLDARLGARLGAPLDAGRFALGTLVQAREREEMRAWAAMLKASLPARPAACRWLLNEMFRSPPTLKELLLSKDDAVREATATVLRASLRQAAVSAGCGPEGRDAAGEAYVAAFEAVREEMEEEAREDADNESGGATGRDSREREQGDGRDAKGERTPVRLSMRAGWDPVCVACVVVYRGECAMAQSRALGFFVVFEHSLVRALGAPGVPSDSAL